MRSVKRLMVRYHEKEILSSSGMLARHPARSLRLIASHAKVPKQYPKSLAQLAQERNGRETSQASPSTSSALHEAELLFHFTPAPVPGPPSMRGMEDDPIDLPLKARRNLARPPQKPPGYDSNQPEVTPSFHQIWEIDPISALEESHVTSLR